MSNQKTKLVKQLRKKFEGFQNELTDTITFDTIEAMKKKDIETAMSFISRAIADTQAKTLYQTAYNESFFMYEKKRKLSVYASYHVALHELFSAVNNGILEPREIHDVIDMGNRSYDRYAAKLFLQQEAIKK